MPEDAALADCDAVNEPEFRFWNGSGDSVWWLGAKDAAGLVGEVRAFDHAGTRVVVQAAYFSNAGEAQLDEIHRMIQSITFEL